ncbi:MAG: YeeE/YedE family protein [Pseudomonadota bacterium]|nr:YeeE/YedE family protein [Pseudomonadota bacterium]
MRSILLSLVVGVVFGVGLLLSGMTQPAKVVNFLDVLGNWDPSLGFVMGGAIAVHFLAYRLIPRLPAPLWAERWGLPTRRDIDTRLLVGAALFGAGWGLGGYCPGPALTSVVAGASSTLIFTGAMLAGMGGFAVWEAARARR